MQANVQLTKYIASNQIIEINEISFEKEMKEMLSANKTLLQLC